MNASDKKPAAGSDGDDHEHHLEPLEEHRLVGGKAGKPVEPRSMMRLLAKRRRSGRERRCLVVQRNHSCSAQDRFSQPAHAEQQQHDADPELEQI